MRPASHANLPHPNDAAPGGAQLAFNVRGVPGQLGLDGRLYGHARPLPGDASTDPPPGHPEGRSPESLLGTNAEFCTPVQDGASGGSGTPRQLVLDLADLVAVPQLDMWERKERQHAVLCAELGDAGFSSNLAKCGITRVPSRKGGVVTLYRDARGTWRHSGHVHCDQWTCASCGPSRARTTAATLGVAMDRWLNGRRNAEGGRHDRPARLAFRDVWMLTLTLPHRIEDWPGDTVDKLFDAHERFKRSAAWRAFCREWGIKSSVRVLDNAHGGKNGTHPHFHLALFPSLARDIDTSDGATLLGWRAHRAMRKADRRQRCDEIGAALWGAWRDALVEAGVTYAVGGEALKLSPGEKAAAYFTGWGLADEVGASTMKVRSHLRLLDAAAAGVEGAGGAFVQWVAATRGKQWVTGLGDLEQRLAITDEDIEAHIAKLRAARDAAAAERGEPVVLVRELQVDVPDALHAAALSLGWSTVHDVCTQADLDGRNAQLALTDVLCAERRRLDLLRTRRRAVSLSGIVT